MGGEYVGPLDNQLSSQRENPEFNSGPLFEWVKKCAIASENYRGLNEGEERDIFELFDNYEKFLTEHFSIGLTQKKFATAAERDGYLKSLIISELGQGSEMANKPLVGQEFLSSMSLSLRRKALADGEPEEVCKSLGIVFNKTDSTYVPTAARTPIETGSGAGFDRGEIRNKLGELLPALIESKLFGENIIVTEGRVSGNQMRVAAYLVVEMPSLQKQILICNELGEAAFVSHVWLGSHIFEEAGKGELQEGYGLTRVVYDKGGNWLERIKELLLKAPEDFSAEEAEKFRALTPVQKSSFLLSRRKINTVEFAQTRRELLDKYPTSKEYLQQLDIWYQNENFAISASQRRRICKQMLGQGPGSDTLINVTKESMIHCGFALYGANDANLNYVYKVEWKRDKGYLTQVLKEGLPEGLTIVKSGFKGFKNSEEFVDEFNLGGTLQRERHCMQLLGFGYRMLCTVLLGRALASDNLDQFYEAALAVFPDDRYLKYLRDRDKPEELSKMVKGDYALTGLKTKLKSSKIDQKYELGKRQFPNSFDFVTSINQADGINGSRRMLSENFGISADAFCSVFGIRKPNSGSATLADLLEAAKVIYPKDKYLAYLDDLKNPEKVKQMILGQYDLSGLKVKILKRKTHTLGLYDLGAKNYPTLQDFIVASKAHHAGIGRFSFLREAVGIGYIDFCRLFLGREPAEEKYYTMAECWEALKQIYTSADDHQMLDEKIVTARILAQKSKAKNSPRNPKNKKPRP